MRIALEPKGHGTCLPTIVDGMLQFRCGHCNGAVWVWNRPYYSCLRCGAYDWQRTGQVWG